MQKSLYPKTSRITSEPAIITEKLDGSNLWIFKLNWELIIAQRNNVFTFSELKNSQWLYKWLLRWIQENVESIDLLEWSWVFWEWIWMWQIWYNLPKRFYIFAKANIDSNLDVSKINYDRSLFIYPFEKREIPDCMWVVPIVAETHETVSIHYLDKLYERYKEEKGSKVEWFIIIQNNSVSKYVRCKNWKETEHMVRWE